MEESAINKADAMAIMLDKENSAESRAAAGILVALIEIREEIEAGFARLDQTQLEASMMLVGCKETFDGYVESRLKADKTLAGVVATMLAKPPANGEKPAGAVDEPKKSAVTLDVGDFGKVPSDSGIA